MGGKEDDEGATALPKVIAWLGIAVVIVCVFVAVHGTGSTGTRIELVGGLLLVGMPAIPLGLIASGRPHRPIIAVTSAVLIVSVEVLVVLRFLHDTHSTAVLGFFYSILAAWVVWGVAMWAEDTIGSRKQPVPPRPDNSA